MMNLFESRWFFRLQDRRRNGRRRSWQTVHWTVLSLGRLVSDTLILIWHRFPREIERHTHFQCLSLSVTQFDKFRQFHDNSSPAVSFTRRRLGYCPDEQQFFARTTHGWTLHPAKYNEEQPAQLSGQKTERHEVYSSEHSSECSLISCLFVTTETAAKTKCLPTTKRQSQAY